MAPVPEISKAWQIHPRVRSHHEYNLSIIQNLMLSDIKTPVPGPGEVLVRMHAAALNFRALLVIADSPNYPVRTTPGLTPCSDGAGEVVSTHTGSRWEFGDRVILIPNQAWLNGGQENFIIDRALGGGDLHGTLSQYRVVSDEYLVAMPSNLSFEQAASIPTAGGTAVQALFHSGVTETDNQSLSGKTVLVQGTGGVSMFALQLAHAVGAKVVATSSNMEKLELARKLGVTHVVDYNKSPEWADEVLKKTGGKGVDLVVEIGGSGTIQQSLKATCFGGTVVIIGILTSSQQADLVPEILYGAKRVRGHLGASKVMLQELVQLFEKHNISPVIGKTFEWEEASMAFEQMMAQGTVGKIVVRI